MYAITITIINQDEEFDNIETAFDYTTNKRDAARIIARETGATITSVLTELGAKTASTIYRDNEGWRAEVFYD